jgi:hypothetical protein
MIRDDGVEMTVYATAMTLLTTTLDDNNARRCLVTLDGKRQRQRLTTMTVGSSDDAFW